MTFFKTVLAVWLALVLAEVFGHYTKEKIPLTLDNDKSDKTFCLSISGLDK